MIRNYITIAIRNFFKNRIFSIINLSGLVISLTAFLLIILYIQYELSFDRFHKDYNRIYRVIVQGEMDGKVNGAAITPAPLAKFLLEKNPDIESCVRIAKREKALIETEGSFFNEKTLIAADSSIFNMFTLPFVNGTPQNALDKPNSVVLTESTAYKYFGNQNPIGKLLTVDHKTVLVVTGVLKDIPINSHFRFDFLASIQSADSLFWKGYLDDHLNTVVYTYVKMLEKSNSSSHISRVENLVVSYYQGLPFVSSVELQPITDIHLRSNYFGEFGANSDILYIYIFSVVAALVLLIACINYTNLSLAVYSTRIREVATRKIFGSSRMQLTVMFYIESLVMLFISLNFAFVLIKLIIPRFSLLIERPLEVSFYNSSFYWMILLLIPVIALLSGGYPTLYITRFKAIAIIKSQFLSNNSKFGVKQMLVFMQFVFSIALIIATIIILRQVSFIKNKDLGFSKDKLILVSLSDISVNKKWELYKQELMQNPKILSVTGVSDIPGELKYNTSIVYEGLTSEERNNPPTMTFLRVDSDFIKTFQLKMANGDNFSKKTPNIGEQEYILNQSAVKFLGWKDPIGKQFESYFGGKGKIIGVVNDFHFKSLHHQIEPLFLTVDSKDFNYLSVRVSNESFSETLTFIQNTWKKFAAGAPMEYYMYESYLDRLYKPETLLGRITLIFSILTIVITCLGLFGLTSFIVFRRTKEIGIRKVNGATIKSILLLLSTDFTKWVVYAFIAACPIVYIIMSKWLQNFAYKTELSWWIFVLAGLIVFTIALLTVVWQSWRAASRNPVEALRYE